MAQGLVAAGHNATVVTRQIDGLTEVSDEEGVIVYRCYRHDAIRSQVVTEKVLHLASELNVDWIEGADHMGECAPLLRRSARPPVIIKVHSCNAIKVVRDSLILFPWQKPLLWLAIVRALNQFLAEKKTISMADLLTAPSGKMIKELRQQKLKLPEQVLNIPNPIHVEAELPALTSANAKKILFAGRLCFGKGVHMLPGLMKFLRGSGVVLEIAGADSYVRGIGSVKSWLEGQFGSDFGQIRFLGRRQPEEMPKIIQGTCLLIVPSRWDNFPTIILEAMKYGKPVVASIHGGMPEMLEGTGCPVCRVEGTHFFESVAQIVNNQTKAEQLGRRMQSKLLHSYVPDVVVPQYINNIIGALNG